MCVCECLCDCVCECECVCVFCLVKKMPIYLLKINCFLKLSDMNNLIAWICFIVRFNSYTFSHAVFCIGVLNPSKNLNKKVFFCRAPHII